jgi:hypothetical protein
MAGPVAFATGDTFLGKNQARSAFQAHTAAELLSPLPRRNFALRRRRVDHRCPPACCCWRCHSTQPIAYSGCGGDGVGPRIASAHWRVYSKMPHCGIGSTRSSVTPTAVHRGGPASSPPEPDQSRSQLVRPRDRRPGSLQRISELRGEEISHSRLAHRADQEVQTPKRSRHRGRAAPRSRLPVPADKAPPR